MMLSAKGHRAWRRAVMDFWDAALTLVCFRAGWALGGDVRAAVRWLTNRRRLKALRFVVVDVPSPDPSLKPWEFP